ncbi:MAG: hypothetical protein KJ990_00630 [Proteobacteria bacterium]|nr:hypothetical protein [Pseudomonadota bacterium]MBU1648434.1 hypothetical protein [Pseudomonadota bacterium]
MAPESKKRRSTKALEDAAKYICTIKCGMCPMAVEKFTCPYTYSVEVRPWQYWIAYFQSKEYPSPNTSEY